MALTYDTLHTLLQSPNNAAWRAIVDHVVAIADKPLQIGEIPGEITRRDREIGELDLFLSSCGWELWQRFADNIESTAARLQRWWREPFGAKAVLILDGLSSHQSRSFL